MRSSSDSMSASPAGRRQSFSAGALGQAQEVSEPTQSDLFDQRGEVIPFPRERSRIAIITHALEFSEACLDRGREGIRELEGLLAVAESRAAARRELALDSSGSSELPASGEVHPLLQFPA